MRISDFFEFRTAEKSAVRPAVTVELVCESVTLNPKKSTRKGSTKLQISHRTVYEYKIMSKRLTIFSYKLHFLQSLI